MISSMQLNRLCENVGYYILFVRNKNDRIIEIYLSTAGRMTPFVSDVTHIIVIRH